MEPNDTDHPHAPLAVTGIGLVSALGVGQEEWLAAAAEGEPATTTVSGVEGCDGTFVAATMPDYDVAPLLDTRKAYLDRHTALLLGATSLALRSAGWSRESLPHERTGLSVGSAWGGVGTLTTYFRDVLTKGAKFAKPILFPHTYANTAGAMAAIEWSLQGPHEVYASGSLASAHALLAAVDTLRAGEADAMLAGGCEALSPAVYGGLVAQGRLRSAEAGATPALPFDPAGHSTVPGEGAAVLVLESRQSAESRGAQPLGTLLGTGVSGDGLVDACVQALSEAGVAADAVTAVFAAGTGVSREDRAEEAALRTLFGDACPPVVALAGLQGDCLGAATALHVAGALLALRAGWLPPLPLAAAPGTDLPLVRGTVRTLPPAPRIALVTALDGMNAAAFVVHA